MTAHTCDICWIVYIASKRYSFKPILFYYKVAGSQIWRVGLIVEMDRAYIPFHPTGACLE